MLPVLVVAWERRDRFSAFEESIAAAEQPVARVPSGFIIIVQSFAKQVHAKRLCLKPMKHWARGTAELVSNQDDRFDNYKGRNLDKIPSPPREYQGCFPPHFTRTTARLTMCQLMCMLCLDHRTFSCMPLGC